jgi:hypothetical protein
VSANLTSGLLRNIEVAALLAGSDDADPLAQLWRQAEGWWAHPAALPWTPPVTTPAHDRFLPDLWSSLRRVLRAGTTVSTLTDRRPNLVVEVTGEAVWIETERTRRLGRGPEPVPAWMFNIAWEHLAAHGRLTNRHLLASDGLNVKRSSAVCAVLALLPEVEVVSRRPIELALRRGTLLRAAEAATVYEP